MKIVEPDDYMEPRLTIVELLLFLWAANDPQHSKPLILGAVLHPPVLLPGSSHASQALPPPFLLGGRSRAPHHHLFKMLVQQQEDGKQGTEYEKVATSSHPHIMFHKRQELAFNIAYAMLAHLGGTNS